jgi:hypothetical protein
MSNNKCSVLFGRECSDSNISAVTSCWEIENTSFEEKYLGIPVPEGRMLNGKYKSIK